MEDGEYRPGLGQVYPLLLPPIVLTAIAVWLLLHRSTEAPSRYLLPISVCTLIGTLAMFLAGVKILFTVRLAITTEGVSMTPANGKSWRLTWSEIEAIRVKTNASVESASYCILIVSRLGDRKIDTTFLPFGKELAQEISRRSGTPIT